MCKKLIYSVSFVLALSLVGGVQAAWTDAGPDHLWSTPENWTNGVLPTAGGRAEIHDLPGPIIQKEGAVCREVRIAFMDEVAALTVDGGTLTGVRWFNIAHQGPSTGTLNMNRGSVTTSDAITVGRGGAATINMKGGTLTTAGKFTIGSGAASSGHVNLDGGTINAGELVMRANADAVGTMNLIGGTFIIDGDAVATVQGFIDNGWITAFGGLGALDLDFGVTNAGKTTLQATTPALKPIPTMASIVPVTLNQLQWTLPEPSLLGGVVTCDVYFGTDGAVEANPKVVIGQAVESVSVTLAPDTIYYWAVDVYDSSVSTTEPAFLSIMFTFSTLNQPPIVSAGDDVTTWLNEGVRIGNLDGTVADDGIEMPYTVQWTVVSEPNAGTVAIETAAAEDTAVTLTAVGQYVLQLEVSDGKFTRSDTVTINAYDDSCEAAQSLPDYVPLVGDINGDCLVDFDDIILLLENWLNDNSLVDEWLKAE